MAHGEAVIFDIENDSSSGLSTKDQWVHVHHGKETAKPLEGKVPPTTQDLSAAGKAMHAMFEFSKENEALYGTEGALLLQIGESTDKFLTIGMVHSPEWKQRMRRIL